MTIYISGANSHVGKSIRKYLINDNEIMSIGRSESDIKWTLGDLPNLINISNEDLLIHCAWDLENRCKNKDENVGGSIRLIKYFVDKGARVVFISSVAALSDSCYGAQKKEVEDFVIKHKQKVIRLGILPDGNRYVNKKKIYYLFSFKSEINVSTSASIRKVADDISRDASFNSIKTYVDKNQPFNEIFGKGKIEMKPFVLKINGKRMHTRLRFIDNLLDSMYSLATTPKIEDPE